MLQSFGKFTGRGIPAPQAFGGSELPPREYIRTDGGIYRWDSGELPVYIDARDFENTAKEALRTHDEALLKRACGLYQGEFLAQLAGENGYQW